VREEDIPIFLDGKKELTLKLHVTFRVDEGFIGVSEKIVAVTSGGDLCGFPFSKGYKYLVYGRRLPNGEVYVSISSATKLEKDATDDLKYLRGLPLASHGATICGTVFRFKNAEDPRNKALRLESPETGRAVKILRGTETYETIVDDRGNFRRPGLPPGRYTILLDADGEIRNYSRIQSKEFDVADKGCARFYFWIDPFVTKESNSVGK
jgi:hypothetical protein